MNPLFSRLVMPAAVALYPCISPLSGRAGGGVQGNKLKLVTLDDALQAPRMLEQTQPLSIINSSGNLQK